MHYQAILFDLDGTLVDSIALYEEAVLQSLREIGIEATHEQFFEWYVKPLHLAQILALYGENEDRVPELRKRRDEIYIDLLRTRSAWLPGAKELLESLTSVTSGTSDTSATSPPLGLITGSWMSYVDAIDEKLSVKQYFGAIITADDTHDRMKPHPHGLLLAADRLGVDPAQCVYIGDQTFDMDAADRAGMEKILLRGKWTADTVTTPASVHTLQEVRSLLFGKEEKYGDGTDPRE